MTYPMTGGPGPGVYPPQPPWTPPTSPPPQPPRRTGTRLALAAAILAAALGGGIIGSLLTRADTPAATSPTTAPQDTATPEYVRAQDVKLCTEYVLINEAMAKPTVPGELGPAAAAVRTSLAAHPEASADVRSALSDVVDAYFTELSHFESRGAKGLVDPPKYDQAAARAIYDRAWAICGRK